MIIYFDGSRFNEHQPDTPYKKRTLCMAYGIVLHQGSDDPIENMGKYIMPVRYDGLHEYIAFLEAFKLLKEHSIDYQKVSFFTDSEEIAYAQLFLHSDNYRTSMQEQTINAFDKAIKLLGMEDMVDEVFDCLNNCRFTKLKSHSGIIDNMRVDYLARKAYEEIEPMPYKEYIQRYDLPFVKHFKDITKNNVIDITEQLSQEKVVMPKRARM